MKNRRNSHGKEWLLLSKESTRHGITLHWKSYTSKTLNSNLRRATMIPRRFFDLQAAAWTSCGGFFIMPTAYFLQGGNIASVPDFFLEGRRLPVFILPWLDAYRASFLFYPVHILLTVISGIRHDMICQSSIL